MLNISKIILIIDAWPLCVFTATLFLLRKQCRVINKWNKAEWHCKNIELTASVRKATPTHCFPCSEYIHTGHWVTFKAWANQNKRWKSFKSNSRSSFLSGVTQTTTIMRHRWIIFSIMRGDSTQCALVDILLSVHIVTVFIWVYREFPFK